MPSHMLVPEGEDEGKEPWPLGSLTGVHFVALHFQGDASFFAAAVANDDFDQPAGTIHVNAPLSPCTDVTTR